MKWWFAEYLKLDEVLREGVNAYFEDQKKDNMKQNMSDIKQYVQEYI